MSYRVDTVASLLGAIVGGRLSVNKLTGRSVNAMYRTPNHLVRIINKTER